MDMTELLKMDIFFFVTTLAVVPIGVLILIILYYLIRILRDVQEITTTVKREAVEIAADFDEVRTDIKEGVHEVRKNVEDGVKTAKTYTKAVAGAGIVRGVSSLLQSFAEEKEQSAVRTKRKRTKRKK